MNWTMSVAVMIASTSSLNIASLACGHTGLVRVAAVVEAHEPPLSRELPPAIALQMPASLTSRSGYHGILDGPGMITMRPLMWYTT